MTERSRSSLDALLAPRSVAIIGASDDPSRVGGRPLRYAKAAGFRGGIYPINPKRDIIQGLRGYPSIDDVPEVPDVAIVAVPAAHVIATVEACAAKGVSAVILFSAGFAEAGPAGAADQARLGEIAAETGMRILGPNCLGVYNSESGFYATFSATFEDGFPSPGGIAITSQSGAYGSHLSIQAMRRNMPVRHWITTGNECDVELAECIAWMVDAPDVSVIAAYAEGVRDGEGLLRALEAARCAGRPVIFIKVGSSEIGAQAAQSHTAALAGSDAVYDAVLRQYGAFRAGSAEEMLDVTEAAALGTLPRGRRFGIMTISGGAGIQMADAAAEYGLYVTPMPEAAQKRITDAFPFAAPRNPVDITGNLYNQPELVSLGLDAMLTDGDYDSIIAFFTFAAASESVGQLILDTFADAKRRYPDRVLGVVMIGPPEVALRFRDAGILVFEDATRSVRTVAALTRLAEGHRAPPPVETAPSRVSLPHGPLGERQALEVLGAAGIPVIDSRLATDAEGAAAAATAVGFPVAMKIASPDLAHKSDIGGVALALADADAVRAAFHTMMGQVAAARPDAALDGVLVAPMLTDGVECILGVSRDPVFGPVVMFGLGGIFVEVLEDVSFRRAPIDAEQARAMIAETRGAKLLAGVRGQPPADVDALAEALAALSQFAAAHTNDVESVDLNPVLVRAAGQGVVALDALIVRRTS